MSRVKNPRRQLSRSVSKIIISGMMLALAVVFQVIVKYIPFMQLTWVQGGTISLAMAPLVLNALLCGPIWGTIIGMSYGVLDMVFDGAYAFNWISVLLDYVLAFGIVGLSGFFSPLFYKKKASSLIFGLSLFAVLRFLCHFFSGLIVWTQAFEQAGSTGPLIPDFSPAEMAVSAIYNLGYMLPSAALSLIVLLYLAQPLFKVMRTPLFLPLMPEPKAVTPVTSTVNECLQDSKGAATSEKEPAPQSLSKTDAVSGPQRLRNFFVTNIGIIFSLLAISIFSTIPSLKTFWLGYIAIVGAIGIITISILKSYHFFGESDRDGATGGKGLDKVNAFYCILLVELCLLPIVVGTIGIASYYSYGYDVYHPVAETGLVLNLLCR